jgi:plastocyanin
MLFESFTVKQDDKGEPILDENGRFIPNALTTIFGMRKEQGFGEGYKDLRNGEWEYVAYNPDKSYNTTPANSGTCARCHLSGAGLAISPDSKNVGAKTDYVLRAQQIFAGATGALPGAVMQQYLFVPQTIQANSGTVLTMLNDDDLVHRVVADDGSWDSGMMNPGASLTLKLEGAGEIPIHCTIHSRMKGKIVVSAAGSAAASIAGSARSALIWSGPRDRSHPPTNR